MPEAAWSFVFGQPSTAGWTKVLSLRSKPQFALLHPPMLSATMVVPHLMNPRSWSKSGWFQQEKITCGWKYMEICLKYVKSKDLKIMSKVRMPHECDEHPWNPCILECELDGTSHIVAAYCFLHSTFQKHCRTSSRKSRNTSNCPRRFNKIHQTSSNHSNHFTLKARNWWLKWMKSSLAN